MVTHQLQVERRTGKVRRPETDVLPLCHATNSGRKEWGEGNFRQSYGEYRLNNDVGGRYLGAVVGAGSGGGGGWMLVAG